MMKLSGICGLFLLATLPGLVAQEVSSTEESLSSEITANWKALQTQAKDLSPEARIAAVDQWQKTQQPKLEALRRVKSQSGQEAQISPVAPPVPVTELERVDAAIEQEIRPIMAAKLSPEERIRQVDAAIEKTTALRERRKVLLRKQAAATATRQPSSQIVEPNTSEGRLAAKTHEILEQTMTMSPEDRIAAIDARKPEVDTLMREVQVSRKAGSATIPDQQKPTK